MIQSARTLRLSVLGGLLHPRRIALRHALGIVPDMPHSFWMPGVLLCTTATSFAIVDANSTTNTSDPGGGVPWANVGSVNGGSGTYLGNGWVLTAAHVGAGPIAFDSGAFQPDGRVIRLSNPDTSLADI